MWLTTWRDTRAERFYGNAGWQVTGQDDGNLIFERSQSPSKAEVYAQWGERRSGTGVKT
jgi:hypothetical protein